MNQDRTKRKLTAIFSADVVGYSRLMEEDEAWTIKSLEENKRLISELIKEYEGRVIDAPGDNLLAEFSSVINAVECAVKIQQELKKKNDNLIEARRMHFRIGVNLGDVVEEDGRIYGRGVNIAARLEALTEPGGICISRRTYDHVKTQLDLGYEYLGEHNVKNISEPIRVYRVLMEPESAGKVIGEKKAPRMVSRRMAIAVIITLVIIAAGLLFWNIYSHQARKIETASTEPEQAPAVSEVKEALKTIAVLPFVDLSPEKDQEYFVDGLSEELLNCLSKLTGLRVTSRTSSFAFKNTDKTLHEVASVLSVDHILEGSVRKSGNDLRITAQLIRVEDDSHLWSEIFNRELKDIFAVQEDIATAVANALKVTFGIEGTRRQLGGTENVEAYELYLIATGTGVWPGDMNSALESIDAAIALDPEFALAWSTKAMLHQQRIGFLPANKLSLDQDAGLHAAQKAIELEPDLADGYFALGALKSDMGDWIEAESALREARKRISEPSLRYTVEYPHLYWFVGHLESSKEIFEESLTNDPFNGPFRAYYIFSLSLIGDMQHAEEQYKLCRSLLGDNFMLNAAITVGRLGSGNLVSLDDIVSSESIFNAAKEHLDSPKEGLAELHKLYIDDNLSVIDFSNISLWASYFGDPDFAMDAMEKSSSLRISNIWYVWFPIYKEVRQTPRFRKLVKDIGLVEYWNKFGWPDICHELANGDFECD